MVEIDPREQKVTTVLSMEDMETIIDSLRKDEDVALFMRVNWGKEKFERLQRFEEQRNRMLPSEVKKE